MQLTARARLAVIRSRTYRALPNRKSESRKTATLFTQPLSSVARRALRPRMLRERSSGRQRAADGLDSLVVPVEGVGQVEDATVPLRARRSAMARSTHRSSTGHHECARTGHCLRPRAAVQVLTD